MKKLNIIILICLLSVPKVLHGTTLGDLAESMAPGTWAELDTLGFDEGEVLYTTRGNPDSSINYANRIIDFAESAAWDPNTKKFMFLGAPSGSAWRFIIYDEASNTWSNGPFPRPCMAYGTNETDPNITYCGGHAFDWNAFDPGSGRFFHTYWKFGPELDIYTPSNNQWTRSSTPQTQIGDLFASTGYRYGAMEWFSERNSLFTLVGGKLVRINVDSNQWEVLPATYEMGGYHNVMHYSEVQDVMVFGGGNDWDPSPANTPNYRDLYRMDASGNVVKLNDAPFYVRVTDNFTGSHPGTSISADPVSGNFLFINKQNLFYELNAVSDTWTQLADAPINSYAVSASISEHGVIMYVTKDKVWLYKHLQSTGQPYPMSSVITGIDFDWDSYDPNIDRLAPGSDNWPITWAENDHQYTSWGDGGGFGGTNFLGRVSLGVARVEGDFDSYTTANIWGGHNAENPATFDGKSVGIIAIENTLYMWRTPGSGTQGYFEARVNVSHDLGATWTFPDWVFTDEDGFFKPTFLQFGKGYDGARDNYVYIYANNLQRTEALGIHTPGEITLMRVPKESIMDRSQYEFFNGTAANPSWTFDVTAKTSVFNNTQEGVGWGTSVSYNPGLDRYLLITEHTEPSLGYIGIFDAPEPWGPWTTVLYSSDFSSGNISEKSFFFNFSNKWLSADGKDFVLVFTGALALDSWNVVMGNFVTTTNTTSVTLSASSTQVNSGETTTLSWNSSNTDSCVASGGWSGSRATFGSETSPAITANTTFTLTCTGDTGSSSDSVTVSIENGGVISLGSGAIITDALVYDENNGMDWSIQTNLQTADIMYGDRSYSFTQIPANLIGQEWLSTANDSRSFVGEDLVTFTLAQDGKVFVLHRDDIANKPNWLSAWTDTNNDVINSEPVTYSVFSRNFNAGEIVSLGINGNTGSGMYVVVMRASQTDDLIFTDGFEQ